MPVTNPVQFTYTNPTANTGSTANSIPHPPSTSKVEYCISGLKTLVYGLAELPAQTTEVTCLWLLHPRLQTQECMTPFAAQFIHNWNKRSSSRGLIAVSFDQRNHGSREVSSITNEAWRSGNEKHAQDMFSCYHGTSTDTSQLLDHLESYCFPEASDQRHIVQNVVLGISLGGHACWHVLMQDERFSTAIITIGCPDYARLMSDRARLSKRKTWLDGQGKSFFGSKDFPDGLVKAVSRFDPAGVVFGKLDELTKKGEDGRYDDLGEEERRVTERLLREKFGNKRILNLSGGSDKLVPYAMGKGFLDWLKKMTGRSGPFDVGLTVEDVVIEGAGHEVPPEMVPYMERFLFETMESDFGMEGGRIGSKI